MDYDNLFLYKNYEFYGKKIRDKKQNIILYGKIRILHFRSFDEK